MEFEDKKKKGGLKLWQIFQSSNMFNFPILNNEKYSSSINYAFLHLQSWYTLLRPAGDMDHKWIVFRNDKIFQFWG